MDEAASLFSGTESETASVDVQSLIKTFEAETPEPASEVEIQTGDRDTQPTGEGDDMLSSVRKPVPQVTGISPKEGPPGTKVTIRGENLGLDAKDVIGLRICGVDCLLSAEWKSPNKIIARTGKAKGKGEIIAVTRSGGVGTCTVTFKGYIVQTGPLQDSAVWIDETQTLSMIMGRNRATSPMTSPDHDDPLGISDEANDTKFPEEELTDMFPDGSGNTAMDNFEPAWFLLENHQGTNFDDLKAGLAYLKRKSTQRNEGPLAFVKGNLTTFMDCQDTLAAMHSQLVSDQKGSSTGCITDPLISVLHKSNESADALFQDVLRRKDRADACRNALGVLHRFKFLFYLPCNIDRNIKKGDYDLVITDYTRAKSLFGETDVQVFKKVYLEVEKRIVSFREMLNVKLSTLPSSLDEQKRLIRYLVHLETPGDPAWNCLVHMQKWLLSLLDKCKNEHIAKEKEGDKSDQKKEDLTLSPKLSAPNVGREPCFKGPKTPQKVQFVDHLTRILQEHLPDLWRLGQAYFSGKLLKEAKDKSSKIDTTKHVQFKEMIQEVVVLFSNLIRAAFLASSLEGIGQDLREKYGIWPDNKQDSPIAWLPICVRYIRSCVIGLSGLDLPSDSLERLQELAFDMRVNCMTTLFTQAVQDIKGLHHRETWMVDSHDERGGTTLLPALFENVVGETAQHLNEVLQAKQGENELFSQTPIEREAVRLTTELLRSFAGTLEQLAVVGNVERPVKNRRTAIAPDLYAASQGEAMPSLDTRLMVMLSNCRHTLEHVLPRTIDNLTRHGYPEMDKVQQIAESEFNNLDKQLFENYIEVKADPIVGALEQTMYVGGFNWSSCLRSAGVRRYVKEAIMGMIEVHAEVYSICPHFVARVMQCITEAVVEEFTRLLQCVSKFNQEGAIQARLDLRALYLAVEPYKTNVVESAFTEAVECIPAIVGPTDINFLEELLNKFKGQMRFQLMCFRPEPKTRAVASLYF